MFFDESDRTGLQRALCCLNPNLLRSRPDAAAEFPGMFFLVAGVVPAIMCWVYAGANFWDLNEAPEPIDHSSGIICGITRLPPEIAWRLKRYVIRSSDVPHI